MPLIDFLSLLSFEVAHFSPIDVSLIFLLVYPECLHCVAKTVELVLLVRYFQREPKTVKYN